MRKLVIACAVVALVSVAEAQVGPPGTMWRGTTGPGSYTTTGPGGYATGSAGGGQGTLPSVSQNPLPLGIP